MTARLTSLVVEDFRSIRGLQRISLDASAVLIHGPNGTGKTSLLSAIEFGLTGAVTSLERFDPNYIQHLPHKLSANGRCRIELEATGLDLPAAEVRGDGARLRGNPLLPENLSRFFTERCYLPQAALGRLLEIYEHQDSRRTDSPLTRFVKELLGLEALDALIDGLHASGDVRRLREPAPRYWSARSDASPGAERLADIESASKAAAEMVSAAEENLRELLEGLAPSGSPLDAASLGDHLEGLRENTETRLNDLARRRRDLNAAARQLASAEGDDARLQQARESAASSARQALDAWLEGPGKPLQELFDAIRTHFSQLSESRGDPKATHAAAIALVTGELSRLQALADADQASASELAEVQERLRQGNARLATIDAELSQDRGANKELAQALTAISTHIENEICPVCGRDFSEVSRTPLAAHVSEEVQRLISAAGRVEGLVRDRSATAAAVAQAERDAGNLAAKQLSPEQRDTTKSEIAQLTEWNTALVSQLDAAAEGTELQKQASIVARDLSILNSRQAGISGLRSELRQHAQELGRPASGEDVPLSTVLTELSGFVQEEEAKAQQLVDRLASIDEALEDLSSARESSAEAAAELDRARNAAKAAKAMRDEAERRISLGKELATRAQALRTSKVTQVFNDELNSVWKELFIRLAPEEAFVPAFALPKNSSGSVEAVLETNFRSGGKGGNPRAMLSAGNLNTAALTLFFALNLSAKSVLPWLIIDDPVQSMDDVHIAQFAALLRTLKREGRQVILAVHDRQLFDYLALELSPTFNGDRLITVELGRSPSGMTTAQWTPMVFEADRALAA